jgi:sugar O-acyltransferase (sialic acid O-acetyltransferase NeuD family)
MKDLYILGAGGFGRELMNMLLDIQNIKGPIWNIMGFLDDTEEPLKGKSCDYQVLGTIVDYQPKENDVLAMGIANPAAKEKIVNMLKTRSAVFESILHPYSYYARHISIGEGAIICAGFGMSVNVSVGDFTTMLNCSLGHDVTVGNYSTISGYSNIMGYVKVGQRVFIGGNVAIAPHVVIEDDAYVGVGSVVLKRVKAGEKVFGNPAKEIGF